MPWGYPPQGIIHSLALSGNTSDTGKVSQPNLRRRVS
jgi:hypothetical protein